MKAASDGRTQVDSRGGGDGAKPAGKSP
jgi:hypothetical protein